MNYFDRDQLLTAIMDRVKEANILIGDHVAPKPGGWSTGQPGTGKFVAYTVLFSGPVSFTPSVLLEPMYDARATIFFRTFGATRQQADDISKRVRDALGGFRPLAGEYRTNLLSPSAISAADRLDDTNPKTWRVVDTFVAECVPWKAKKTSATHQTAVASL